MESRWPSRWLRLLLCCYYPFLLLLCAFMGWLLFLLVQALIHFTCVVSVALPLIVLLGLTLAQFLWSLLTMLQAPAPERTLELRLSVELLAPVYHVVTEIVRQQKLLPPHEIRLGADTVAHVYEENEGRRVLVLGGLAVAVLSQTALAGVIAHELAHFTTGDTRLLHRAAGRALMMQLLEYRFKVQPGTQFNPLVWLIRLYHALFELAFLADSRQREFAADRQQVQQAGKEEAAAALLFIETTERLPWVRLENIIQSAVATNEQLEQAFSEVIRRAENTSPDEWREALQKAMRKKTGLYDSHPALRDRLKAMGMSPKKCLRLLLRAQSGALARALFPEWQLIERVLTEQLLQVYREDYLAKREMVQILLGRPVR